MDKGYEGAYWDYKEDYTDCKEDKLIDIICMANNIEGHDAYLIYGVDDNGNVKGIEKTTYSRYTTKSVTEFLRSKPFAGGYVPNLSFTAWTYFIISRIISMCLPESLRMKNFLAVFNAEEKSSS